MISTWLELLVFRRRLLTFGRRLEDRYERRNYYLPDDTSTTESA